MIQQSKIESAKDQANIAAKNIRERQREQQRLGGASAMQGIGNNTISTTSDDSSVSSSKSYRFRYVSHTDIWLQLQQ